MRLHRLEVQAFGPFRDRQSVDFDGLSSAGLFLLHGATGAGKTSVLDAICYALYGRVPGTRGGTSTLRSHYAAAQDQPEVMVEFSVADRRFTVHRSPAWERPKKRGTGTTNVSATVRVCELIDQEWQARATRLDDAAHLLQDVVGMGPDQFTQLVLLPQGEFASFLSADADQRRALLERIFATDRFADVADRLREERSRQRARIDRLDRITEALLARAEQAAAPALGANPGPEAEPPGGAWPLHQTGSHKSGPPNAVEEGADPEARVATLKSAVDGLRQQAMVDHHAALRAAAEAEVARDRSEAIVALAAEHAALAARLRAADERRPEIDAQNHRIEAARRAAPVSGWSAQVAAAQQQIERARAELEREAASLPPTAATETPPGAAWRVEQERVLGDLRLLEALEPDIEQANRLKLVSAQVQATVDQSHRELAAIEVSLTAARQHHADLQAELATAAALAGTLDAERATLAETKRRAAAVRDRDAAEALLKRLSADHDAAREVSIQARAHYLDCRERRLQSLAAELAGSLVTGEPCRVCGATAHPDPATPEPAAVDAEREDAARLDAEAATDRVAALASELAACRSSLTAAAATADGWTAPTATAALSAAKAAVATAETALHTVTRLEAEAAAAHESVLECDAELARCRRDVTAAEQELAVAHSQYAQVLERLDQARGDHEDLAERMRTLRDHRDRLQRALAAEAALTKTTERLTQMRSTAEDLARQAGFADLATAAAALLDAETLARLDRQRIEHNVEVESVQEQLADERFLTLNALDDGPIPDAAALTTLRDQAVEASFQQDRAKDQARRCEDAGKALADISLRLRDHLTAAAPARAEFDALDDLVRCVDGNGGDNSLRMSLPAYVLAARLEQVAAAATVRLEQMSGGRYALVHTDSAAKGRGRSGLSLEVVDSWTGVRRPTGTLSGGEAFYTSLALALGLADVVAAEAGGVRMDTLFIDEGFGSLDEETLEEVMDTLDGLRSGGRAVGIVSHLAELRQRIGTRLEVKKSEQGSRLTLVG